MMEERIVSCCHMWKSNSKAVNPVSNPNLTTALSNTLTRNNKMDASATHRYSVFNLRPIVEVSREQFESIQTRLLSGDLAVL